jgi:MFS family permease
MALATGIAAPAIPVFSKSFDVSIEVASLVFSANLLGGVVSTLPTGYLVDRIGRRKIILAGPLLLAVSSILTANAHSFPELLAYRFIGGWAHNMWTLGRLAMIADTGATRSRGRQITGMLTMETTGRLMGPAVGGFIASAFDVRMPFLIHAALCLLAIVPSFKLIRESAPDRRADHAPGRPAQDQRGALAALMTLPMIMFLCAQLFASFTRGTLFSGAMHLYPVYAYGVGSQTIGVIATIASAIGIPITLTSGHVMDRFGRKATIVPGFSLLCVSFIFMAFTAYEHTMFELWVLSFLMVQASQSITSGNMQTLGSDMAPAHARGKFMGMWQLIGNVGTTLSPAVFGFVSASYGYAASFGVFAFTALGAALIVGTQVRETVRREDSHATEGAQMTADSHAAENPRATETAEPTAKAGA